MKKNSFCLLSCKYGISREKEDYEEVLIKKGGMY